MAFFMCASPETKHKVGWSTCSPYCSQVAELLGLYNNVGGTLGQDCITHTVYNIILRISAPYDQGQTTAPGRNPTLHNKCVGSLKYPNKR